MVKSDHYRNRELSWLDFNRRVLAEAWDDRNPLLERVRFLSIVTSNLDEFFMNRLGGIKQRIRVGIPTATPDGLTPSELFANVRNTVLQLIEEQATCYMQSIKPMLEERGIFVLRWDELNGRERSIATQHFEKQLFPILTPQAVDPGRPFPAISNLSYSLGVVLTEPGKDEKLFARVKVPGVRPKLLRLDPNEYRFINIAEVIRANADRLFAGMRVQAIVPFRLTRNADLALDEEDADDLLELIKEELRERRFAQSVRLECGEAADPWALDFLLREVELGEEDLYRLPAGIDLRDLQELADLPLPQLRYDPWVAPSPPQFGEEEQSLFAAISASDVLVHHPYESFSGSVERFLRAAVDDPKVLSIKMTLYRTGDKSTIVPLLVKAAELGKQVVCLIELKAHFDEATNIKLAETLEASGVYVMYGLVGLKTHAKVVLIAREERDEVRCYAHLGTGNYNAQTAKVYTDIGLFTCDRGICDDLLNLFNYLTGRSLAHEFTSLLVAPFNMRERFLELIEREKQHALAGRKSRIVAKMNGLEDQNMCAALYDAAAAGVDITLIVRGLCCMRAKLPEQGGKIRVLSVLGRFLEHSRVFYFANGREDPLQGDFFLGSADWMQRNLSRRVEVVSPVLQPHIKARLWEVLEITLADRRQAWEQQSDGSYTREKVANDGASQELLMARAKELAKAAAAKLAV